MRLGIISDVHGDSRALNRALALLRGRHGVDAVWCAGDLVGRGGQPDEVVARVVGSGIPTVMGNHDEMVLWGDIALGYHPHTLRLLHSLPRTYRVHLGGHTLVMVHGSPRSNTEGITINPAERQRGLAWLPKIGADVLITGHTHAPLVLQDYRGLVVNPGSLFDPTGFSRSSSETYGVLDLDNMHFAYHLLWD